MSGIVVEDQCKNCHVPLEYYRIQKTEVEGRCKPCNDFLIGLKKLSDKDIEKKLRSKWWNDNEFAVFCDEYQRRGMQLPA